MIQNVIDILCDLENDLGVPKNVKCSIQEIIGILRDEDEDAPVKVNKALNKLDEISDDHNMESYVRTQIWNIASILEKF